MSSCVYQHTLPFNGSAFKIFNHFRNQPHVFFLDSSLRRGKYQFSYIGFAPFGILRGQTFSGLRKAFHKYRIPHQRLSFPAGAVGYLGYDGSMFWGFYDTILAVDHQHRQLIITSLDQRRMNDVIKQLQYVKDDEEKLKRYRKELVFKSNFTKTEYVKAVRLALEHIRQGDIYQINLSHQIKVKIPDWSKYASPAAIYRILRSYFPSEFGAYFDDGRQVILSASPERFLSLKKKIVQVKPMKGTRPRGTTKDRDMALRRQLQKSPKEIAELLMVTDLERNDLGRVCDYATVKVAVMRTIEAYASVFQATSTIEGRLRGDCDQFDLLKATFPSGSVTGCPKIEAMKIIEELESSPRGLYTGVMGYISFSGDMDFNVMIRTMFLTRDQISFHVGGGIVADSKPQAEWQETWDKAKPLIETLNKTFQ